MPHLVVISFGVRHIHVVGGGADIFILLICEYVNSNQVNLQRQTRVLNTNTRRLKTAMQKSDIQILPLHDHACQS